MLLRSILLFIGIGLTLGAAAEDPMLGPVIDGYGPTYAIDDRDVALQEGAKYRAVFDALSYSDDVSKTSTRLVSIARFLNMHARNGTPVENMDLAVVIHGPSVKTVLNHAAYRARYGMDNPSLDLVRKLDDAGVRFYICGQSMAFGGVAKDELAEPIQVALSAMTMLTVLQNDGYALLAD